MAFVDDVPEEELPEACTADAERFGYLPNFSRAFAHRPAAYAAWKQLNGAIKETMDERRYELATVAAARRLRSTYCSLVHGKVLADRFYSPDEVTAILLDARAAGLDEVDVAVIELAEKVAGDATAVTHADVDRLRTLGLSDAEVVDVVLAAAARCFFSTTLDALGVEADTVFAELDPALRDTLVVGRPIAGA
jgi:uncharacterized peroxidase-related enzyme